jgi:hypothetical protein
MIYESKQSVNLFDNHKQLRDAIDRSPIDRFKRLKKKRFYKLLQKQENGT